MRTLFVIILIICCLASVDSHAQAGQKIPVPMLKDGGKIDDLLNIIFQQRNKNIEAENKSQTDSCIVIYMLKLKGYVSFGIAEKSNAVINGIINKMFFHKANFGYFQYRKHNIFVWTEKQFDDFATQTPDTKIFDFIFKIGVYKEAANERFIKWHYKYENGRFSIEGPPSIAD